MIKFQEVPKEIMFNNNDTNKNKYSIIFFPKIVAKICSNVNKNC